MNDESPTTNGGSGPTQPIRHSPSVIRPIKSIKWRLQLWYGLILVAVLVGFGLTSYQLDRGRAFRRVDDEIHLRINVLARQLHHPPHGPMSGPFEGRHPEGEGPPPDFPGDGGPPEDGRPPRFVLNPQTAALFDTNDPNAFYFVLRGPDGNEIARSGNVPSQAILLYDDNGGLMKQNQAPMRPADSKAPRYDGDIRSDNPPGTRLSSDQPDPRTWGDFREIEMVTPTGERMLVGRNIKPELAELHLAAVKLAGFGALILFIGFAGGWLFVGRALRPISEISSTAAKISAGDLSQRINTAEAGSELGQLAAVLNATFARLETAFAQQKQFASDAAHELRTPVWVILTQTQMALARERDAAGYKQTVEACQRAAQRMRKLIESLLELARFDAGQEVLKRLPFDLAKTVADCAEMVQPLAGERHVKIIAELAPLQITGDSERLGQVITNLLTNAIQYNQPDGEVRVTLTASNGLAVIAVADTGKGIAPDDLPRVFERFYRADKSRTGGGNTGLGLSICKAIVEAHGGTIEALSHENVGTNFIVRLPVAN